MKKALLYPFFVAVILLGVLVGIVDLVSSILDVLGNVLTAKLKKTGLFTKESDFLLRYLR